MLYNNQGLLYVFVTAATSSHGLFQLRQWTARRYARRRLFAVYFSCRQFSAAIRRGLIEACGPHSRRESCRRFPRRFAAASLKRASGRSCCSCQRWFSAAIRRGLIEAWSPRACHVARAGFSAAIRRGLIEAGTSGRLPNGRTCCFQRRFAAASLKRLVELREELGTERFPRRFAAASLKLQILRLLDLGVLVFRGDSPRPH